MLQVQQKILIIVKKGLCLMACLFIRLYQLTISPYVGKCCIFYPSCSKYAYKAIKTHGIYGLILAFRRLVKCHPYSDPKYDPVPPKR